MKPKQISYERYEYLTVEVDEHRVALVTLNRPDRLNAINGDFHEEIRDVWIDLGNDYEVNAIVLTGAGRAFCAGGDVRDMDQHDDAYGTGRPIDPLVVMNAEARRVTRNILDLEQPLIAAVNGDAFGLGASLALLSDIVVVNEGARIADTHVNIGLVAGDGGAVMWPLLLGPHRAKEFLLRGTRLSGTEAAELGMVNYALPADRVLPEAMTIARELAAGAPMAIRWTKLAVNKWLKTVNESVFDLSIGLELTTMASQDRREGMAALREKRPPKFTGF